MRFPLRAHEFFELAVIRTKHARRRLVGSYALLLVEKMPTKGSAFRVASDLQRDIAARAELDRRSLEEIGRFAMTCGIVLDVAGDANLIVLVVVFLLLRELRPRCLERHTHFVVRRLEFPRPRARHPNPSGRG